MPSETVDPSSITFAQRTPSRWRLFDYQFWLAMILAALIVYPRAMSIADYHNDYYDDAYHLIRGVRFITTNMRKISLNDPPIGEVITAWPLYFEVTRSLHRNPPIVDNPIYNQGKLKAEWLFSQIVKFKAVLFLPAVMIVFLWIRRLYGIRSAWLAMLLFIFEPTVTAHISTAAVDVLGLEGIIFGCFFTWLYFRNPRWWRLIPACVAIAGALLLKHTAIIFPGVVLAFAILWWGVKPWADKRNGVQHASVAPSDYSTGWFYPVRRVWRWLFGPFQKTGWIIFFRTLHVLFAIIAIPVLMWAMCGFEWSKPVLPARWVAQNHPLVKTLDRELPMGVYIGSLVSAMDHGERGHAGFLFGETRNSGWWYYFPVVAYYKVPIGYWLIGLLAIASIWLIRPKWDEWSLLLPAAAWSIFIIQSGVNIGWRHFLPAYVPILLLASRVLASRTTGFQPAIRSGIPRGWTVAVCVCAIVGMAHAASAHPNYLSYFNFPRFKPYLSISDSNVDWGQAIKQIRTFLRREKKSPKYIAEGRPVYVRYFCRDETDALPYFIEKDSLATVLRRDDRLPDSGILILSAVWEAGGYDPSKSFAPLWKVKPITSIGGGAVQVYDLDKVVGWKDYVHSRQAATRPVPPAVGMTNPSTKPAAIDSDQ